ncbi:DEAD/DEAH box helicase [Nocardioides lianchengensis]|uniref:Probable helicase HelY n=1 Tax=Nocardioides lianchengensis TaxID=1045774 RepID=A0A1G6SW70_9ACTN|nr:DEAD/DEAH box helicase [Nocardioides lianchengensis]NYG09999.1 ATP-dependent RNA helicase HelY [Nocardioides lianchengensis]SDD21132.1 ATP-dependent RNA helicase HelY [Nocardioides lianchengensis]
MSTDELSPSERYASYRENRGHPVLKDFQALHEFPLDDFQLRACREIEDGRGVLVAAPTGSGKTIVGEFAIHLALQGGRKAFYTTPIKALSNQKYQDLVARYGADQVGLLTGDNTVNGEAPIVVMTTEVLRNMLYAGSRTLVGLGFVIMDEVHYLADRSRGAVWEEVIIHLPESVTLVSLSATVSNAEEFGEWLATVRGETATILEERRPVPLYQHVMVGRRLLDLFADSDVDAAAGFVKEGAPVNNELMKVARDDWAASKLKDRRSPRGAKGRGGPRQVGNGRRVWIPSRADVVERLDREGLLPAIVFIFSRVGCDAAVTQALNAGIRLTSAEERDTIFAYVEAACRHLPEEDLHVLGYHDFLDGLTRGVAAHHAGMLPAFKQCVEEMFLRGLCKVVFATETLALGINMPARTVVIEKLSKWNGETHADITPGEYTQLTGRAGRRGLDTEGHGVVLWQPGMNPREVAGLASTRTYPLRSSFRPSYNMAVNLVNQFGRDTSRQLLEQSFAQFQADKAVVGLARQVRKAEEALDGYRESASCHLGDFMEYAGLRRRISDVEKDANRARKSDRRDEAIASLKNLRPGDVIQVPTGKFAGYAVVIDPGWSEEGPRPYVVTADRQARRLAMIDFPTPVVALTRLKIPKSFNGRNPQMRRDLASALRSRTHDLAPPPPGRRTPDARSTLARSGADEEVARLRAELKAHPCHACPDREDHARWAERWFKLDRDTQTLKRRVESRTNTVARQFDRVCDVLTALDYLDGDEITPRGRHLMRLYSELDLVAAECLRLRLWEGLDASELAAVLSVLVFEARRPDDASSPRVPGGPVKDTIAEMVRLWGDLDRLEKDHKLDYLRQPDLGFAWLAYRWAEGDELDDLLGASELAAGDFVRWMKQLLDLAGQVADAAGDGPVRATAREVVRRLRRGVVAYSGLAED